MKQILLKPTFSYMEVSINGIPIAGCFILWKIQYYSYGWELGVPPWIGNPHVAIVAMVAIVQMVKFLGQWVNIELIHIDSRPGRPQRLECLCCFSLSQSIEVPNLDPFCHMRIAWGDDLHMRIWWGHSWFIRIFIQEWHDWFYIWGLGILLEDDGDRRYIIYPRKTCLFEKSFNYPSP